MTCVYLIMPRSDTACFQAFHNALSRKFARQDILLVLDGAPTIAAATSRFPTIFHCSSCHPTRQSSTRRKSLGEIREKIFKDYALKSIDAVRDELTQAILYIERNPTMVKSIKSL
jgi:hypothetical protein